MEKKPTFNNSKSFRHTKFTNTLESMFNKITSKSTHGTELNILQKDIGKTTLQIDEEFHKVLPTGGKFRKEFLNISIAYI